MLNGIPVQTLSDRPHQVDQPGQFALIAPLTIAPSDAVPPPRGGEAGHLCSGSLGGEGGGIDTVAVGGLTDANASPRVFRPGYGAGQCVGGREVLLSLACQAASQQAKPVDHVLGRGHDGADQYLRSWRKSGFELLNAAQDRGRPGMAGGCGTPPATGSGAASAARPASVARTLPFRDISRPRETRALRVRPSRSSSDTGPPARTMARSMPACRSLRRSGTPVVTWAGMHAVTKPPVTVTS
jgi:hypothetical protein